VGPAAVAAAASADGAAGAGIHPDTLAMLDRLLTFLHMRTYGTWACVRVGISSHFSNTYLSSVPMTNTLQKFSFVSHRYSQSLNHTHLSWGPLGQSDLSLNHQSQSAGAAL